MHEPAVNKNVRITILLPLLAPFIWGCALFLFMNSTSPLQSGPLSVLIFFVLAYLFALSVLYLGSRGVLWALRLFGMAQGLTQKQLYYLVSVISLGPVFLLALNTLGTLEVKEFLMVAILIALGCFYVVRRGKSSVA